MSRGITLLIVGILGFQLGLLAMAATPFAPTDPPGDEKKDTTKAIVTYGREYLFKSADDISVEKLNAMVDSLLDQDTIDHYLLNEIELYRSVLYKPEAEIYALIDSLFELEKIPYPLINELNLYISHMSEDDLRVQGVQVFDPNDTSDFPANAYYRSWNSRYPFNYPGTLSEEDSVLVLLLRSEEKNWDYKHPLGPKSLRRYFGIVTSGFGWRDGRSHNGVDLELHLWDTVYNCFPGVVRMAKNYGGYGNVVVVRHYNGLETLYAHLSRIKVKTGQEIKAGEPVGLGGSTGSSTGTHLHLEMRFKGIPLNPAHIISFKDRDLYADTLVLKRTRRSYAAYPLGTKIHTVQRGEYVSKVARRYGISSEKLCELNGIGRKTRLVVGQKLRISD